MKKTISHAIYSAVLAAVIGFGCGGDDGQSKGLNVGDLLDAITGGGTPSVTHTLTVNLSPSNGGSVSRSPNNTTYKTDEQVTVTATAADGWMFTGWSDDVNETTATVTVTMNRDLKLTANFVSIDAPTHTLTVKLEPSGGGNVSREPNRTVYSAGEQVTVTATTADGYTFTGWSGDANGADPSVTVTMNRDLALTANFQQNTYSLSTGANTAQGGTVSRNPDKAVYTFGEQITVAAEAADGYSFTGWSGDTTGTANPVIITMDGNKTLTAIFEQQKYKLTTNVSPSGYGSVLRNPNKETYAHGEQVTVTATETPPSGDNYYAFDGWTGAVESKSAGVTITMDGNKTLTANFTRGSVPYYTLSTITNPNVGTISRNPDNASYRENQTVTVTAPTVNGYTFTGWSGDATGTANSVTVTMNKNTTLTANYTQSDFTLTTNVNPAGGGDVSREPNRDAYNHNDDVTVTAVARNCYTFTGWSGDASGTANPLIITMGKDKTVMANFQPSQYTLATETSPLGSGSVSRSPNQTSYGCGATVTVTATAASGYTFKEWQDAAAGTIIGYTNQTSITMDGNYTLKAVFQPIQYTLTTSVQGNGAVTRNPSKDTYVYGDQVSVTAAAAPCNAFIGWSGAATGTTNPVTITITGNTELKAHFQQIPYTFTTSVSPSGGGSVSPSGQTSHTCGTSVTVTAMAASCYTFTGWSGAATGTTNPLTITVDGNKELIANFQQTPYTLTTNVSPQPQQGGGSVSRSLNKDTYNCGEKVTLTATAQNGYPFTGWSGDTTSTANPIIITMDKSKTVTANFQQDQYTLTTNVSPSGGGSVSPAGQTIHPHGTQVFVTAAAEPNCHTFGWWSGDATGTANPVYITMDRKKDITANFNQNEYTLSTSVSPSSSYGYVSRSPYQTSYPCGTSVTVTAVPTSSNYMFDTWIGVPSGVNASSNPITFTVNSNVALTARFKVKKTWKDSITTNAYATSPYIFNSGFPAIVEIYAFGAGGGASGGSRNAGTGDGGKEVDTITGGGGGGGAAAYARFGIASSTNDINKIYVTVGQGGSGGAFKSAISGGGWNYGEPGKPGGASTVKIGNTATPELTVVAGGGGNGLGGVGGHVSNPDPDRGHGGAGGTGTVTPRVSSFLDTVPIINPGKAGQDGAYCNSCKTSNKIGGTGGILSVDGRDESAGKGGDGRPNTSGLSGSPGKVIIKFTWWE